MNRKREEMKESLVDFQKYVSKWKKKKDSSCHLFDCRANEWVA